MAKKKATTSSKKKTIPLAVLHFKKISHGKKMNLVWTNDNGDELNFSTKDDPLPEWTTSFQALEN